MGFQLILSTIVLAAAALLGFSGVVFSVGHFSQSGLIPSERMGLVHLLIPATAALFLSLLTLIFATSIEPDFNFWRFFNALLALVHLIAIFDATRRIIHGQAPGPMSIQVIMLLIGYLMIIVNIIVAIGFFQNFASVAYMMGITWFLFISASQFILLVLSCSNDEG